MLQRRRPIPRLRTKSGCIICRQRRKKCDENKPRCRGCTRNNHRCVWPEQPSRGPSPESAGIDKKSISSIQVPDLEGSEDTSNGSSPLSHRDLISTTHELMLFVNPQDLTCESEEYLLFYFKTRFMPLLVRPHAHPIYQDPSYICSLADGHAWVRNAYIACSALHASWEIPRLQRISLENYNAAIGGLQSAIKCGQLNGSEDYMLSGVIFLYIYEVCDSFKSNPHPQDKPLLANLKPVKKWHCNPSSLVALHLDGMARVLRVRIEHEKLNASPRMLPFYRIAAESFVYQVATLSLFNPEVAKLSGRISWIDLESYMRPDLLESPCSSTASPLLGSHFGLYKLIFEVSSLYHKINTETNQCNIAIKFDCQLALMREDLEDSLSSSSEEATNTLSLMYRRETLLYVLSAQILVFGLLYPKADINHPRIRELSDTAIKLVYKLNMLGPCSSYFCWPMMILAQTVVYEEDVEFLKGRFVELWQLSLCGQIRRSAKTVDELWRNRDLGVDRSLRSRLKGCLVGA